MKEETENSPTSLTDIAEQGPQPAGSPERVRSEDVGAKGRAEADEQGEEVVQRYCHLYVKGELSGLCKELGGGLSVRVEEEYWDCSNNCIRLTRLS